MPTLQENVYEYKEAQSQTIDFNNGTITSAKMTVTYTGDGYIALWLSANGGQDWESVTNATSHNFTITGTDLRWRIGGSGVVITKIVITITH